MTVIIQESRILADLIPEVHYYMDSDSPVTDELLSCVSLYLSKLVRRAFHQLSEEAGCAGLEPDWLRRLRSDPTLIELSILTWVEVQVLDSEGTFIIVTKEALSHVK